MTTTITCEYVRSIASTTEYVVDVRVISAIDIELDIFVFDTASQRYISVATPFDMQTWPASRAEALTLEKSQFRARGVLRTSTTPEMAEYFETVTRSRVSLLQTEWELVRLSYPGSETITVPTP